MRDERFAELQRVEEALNEAMVSNDVQRIETCITDDCVLVTAEAGVVTRDRILGAIASGVLGHDTMIKDVQRVCVYGDMAVVTGRGRITGHFRGQPIAADEWVT